MQMVFKAKELIKQAIERYKDNIAVACSFGKDSMVVLHMALKYKPDIKVVFNNTMVEFPETIQFKERIKEEWNLNLIETKPYKNMTFWKCIEKYGFPTIRRGGLTTTSTKINPKTNKPYQARTPKCCYYLKEKPAIDCYKKYGIKAILTGLMKSESRNRMMLISKKEINKCIENWD